MSKKFHPCSKCKHLVEAGYQLDPKVEEDGYVYEGSNPAERDACLLLSNHDFDYDYTNWFYVERNEDGCTF